ncbi:hypothetical protein [Pseudoalteromonas aurantia]|uniref:Iron transporter n=1 Tax=Pseudoalteromonas aurantia 208 TaxID=1314867 RepID=A0ABR9EHU8_9GAMM|nr:hypothetical protein [Pseudoalteromonas aurantia]MBE0370575.1 hypothetical protein [Pseudoalteromonas aurantia 208]
MLLNTVIISLNQFLPLGVLWVLLSLYPPSTLENREFSHTLGVFVFGLISCFIYLWLAGDVSQWFDFLGLELAQITFLCGIYASVLALIVSNYWLYKYSALVCAMLAYLSHFMTYLSSYGQVGMAKSMLIGTVLGMGLCVSFIILLYFSLVWVRNMYSKNWLIALITLHCASKIATATDLASQVDLISASSEVFNLKWLLDEYSIIGRVLKALIGYEASPSMLSLASFLIAVFVMLIAFQYRMKMIKIRGKGA